MNDLGERKTMSIVEISKIEIQKISENDKTYFLNGVVFENATDNVVAFEQLIGENFTYWKVTRR